MIMPSATSSGGLLTASKDLRNTDKNELQVLQCGSPPPVIYEPKLAALSSGGIGQGWFSLEHRARKVPISYMFLSGI